MLFSSCNAASHVCFEEFRINWSIPVISRTSPILAVMRTTSSSTLSTVVSYTTVLICPRKKRSRHDRPIYRADPHNGLPVKSIADRPNA
ncbi:hypothetical protein AVEN_168153-1 [Araneus ventricosus]|uniref:Uncharacterized protein n=1 Tax=Araneus ventricosus TaxID=182803 RepID=A0A4Y2QV78_ARAVE|nr:hypothetical protein AVEN_168153-1 [Araneus ventricosus]